MIAILYISAIVCFGASCFDGVTPLELGILLLSLAGLGEYLKRLADGPGERVMVIEDAGKDQ